MKRKFQTDIEPFPVAKPKTSIIEMVVGYATYVVVKSLKRELRQFLT